MVTDERHAPNVNVYLGDNRVISLRTVLLELPSEKNVN